VTGGDGASFNNTDYGQFGAPRNPCGDPPVPVGGMQSAPSAQGGALRSQDLRTPLDPTTLDGSVLRIDPNTGAGLPDNPLSSSLDANARRIVATGLRNPFRLALRPGTSQIFVGDVGWGAWEEVNRIDNATDGSVDNFGWPCYEGDGRQGGYDGANLTICEDLYAQPAAARQPFFTYSHGASVVSGDNCATGNGSSTSGLAFYQGGAYPASYDGALFFADYSRRCVWVMFEQGGQPLPSTRQVFATSIDPVNLKIGPSGDLFIVDYSGSIRRMRYSSDNHPPTAVAQATPTTGPLPLTVNFDGRGSSDPDAGDSLTYAWDLDADGLFDDSFSAQSTWTYTSAGPVTARLRVTDSSGDFDTDSVEIRPGGDPPQAMIATPAQTLRWAVGDTISFSGSASDPQDGTLPDSALKWSLMLQHCTTVDECHSHTVRTWEGISGGPDARFDAPDHPYPSHLELRLTATDSSGLTDTETVRLDPRTVDLTFRTEPSGLRLAVGSTEEATPFTRTVIVGSTNSVSAPSSQALGGTAYRFTAWSDGGAQVHDFVAPSSASTYTANYELAPPPSGLVAAFGFNEGSGGSAGDASPEGNGGVVSGASWSAAGRFGGALSFDGVNDWVTVADDPSLDLAGALTVEAWVRPTTTLSSYRTVALKEHPPGAHAYALYASDGSGPSGEVWTSTWHTATGPALGLGAWKHLAVTYSQGTVRLYIDGSLAGSKAVPGAVANAAGPLRIGGNAIWGEYFSGLIDELRVYNRALSAAEIQTDMTVAVGP
jgi:PKD repeat protein